MGETGETFGWCLEVEPIAEKKPDSEERLSDFCNEIVWSSQYVGPDMVRSEAIGDLKQDSRMVLRETYRAERTMQERLLPSLEDVCLINQVITGYVKIKSFIITGELSPVTCRICQELSIVHGWVNPALVRSPRPPWILRLLHTGEAVACLSLAANQSIGVTADMVGKRCASPPALSAWSTAPAPLHPPPLAVTQPRSTAPRLLPVPHAGSRTQCAVRRATTLSRVSPSRSSLRLSLCSGRRWESASLH